MLPNTGGLVYGTITVGTLLAAASSRRETYGEIVVAVTVALLVYWLAHAYSEFAEFRLERGEPVRLETLRQTLTHELTIVAGAAMPLLALVICWVIGAQLGSAVTAAIWVTASVIIVIEVISGVRAGLSGGELVLQIAFGTLFGLLVVGLRLILHP